MSLKDKICTCGFAHGWTNKEGEWVCADCLKPSSKIIENCDLCRKDFLISRSSDRLTYAWMGIACYDCDSGD